MACVPGESNSPEILADTKDMYVGTDMLKMKPHTLFVEGVKPITGGTTTIEQLRAAVGQQSWTARPANVPVQDNPAMYTTSKAAYKLYLDGEIKEGKQ